MLVELRARELGVIADLDVVLGAGLTALTGETGAGKTLVVEALSLLVGGRADPAVVRGGADEAFVEGRFVDERGEELVLGRAIPASGRSRGFVGGRMATAGELADLGRSLVDLYGQHEHQSLLQQPTQRQALDRYAGVDLGPVRELRSQIAQVDARIAALGGDERSRARELDLLSFELAEIEALAITSASEDDELASEESALANAVALREAAESAYALLSGEGRAGAADAAGEALGLLEHHLELAGPAGRLRSLLAELADTASELRRSSESFEEDPARLSTVRARRARIHALVRKHGDDLGDVLRFADDARRRVDELLAGDAAVLALAKERSELGAALDLAESAVGDSRRAAAPGLAHAVEGHFGELALARARLRVVVPDAGIGDDVELLLAANLGEPFVPLAKAASGGELARTMLALRLVLATAPPTLVFDEVDAGIGGEAALAVGRALALLARDRQVIVVTHLAQVAAHADRQIAVAKSELNGRTVTRARAVEGDERLAELSRMLSGHPGSAAAREHAAELLSGAQRR
ncbi:MAG TPA: DNA repair protein RecN [Acidimicrobiales bacterium]|nr:DNA repair protein RecN [Acidimicrobiales bacterium]